ncbi:MAG: MATE family efflux transporter [Actinomycetaceae bacterium]|nr:MATE family efflux transporter [Actinomycetaceae bacterium]
MNDNSKPEVETSALPSDINRQILNLALPALGALVAQPLLTTIDSGMVGHLGTAPLAGLALASTILTSVVGLFIFLAYSTTALTSRATGAGRPGEGLQNGINAIWLAAVLGILSATALMLGAKPLVAWFNPTAEVSTHALAYLHYASPGLVGMLVVLAATGTLRGTLDTRTPFIVATVGAAVNAILNAVLIYGANMGIAGSALGTAITETLMGAVLTAVVVWRTRPYHLRFRFNLGGVWAAAHHGSALLVRTVSLRLAFLATVWAVTKTGTTALAAHQSALTVWMFSAFALDALAIAAQALIGHTLGAEDVARTRALVRRIIWWGLASGAVIGLVIVAGSPLFPWIFGTDAQMRSLATTALIIGGILQVVAGYVYVLDGILMGAGDNRYLAIAGVINIAVYLPLLWLIVQFFTPATGVCEQRWVLGLIWVSLAGAFMGMRALTTGWRLRTDTWMHLPDAH